MLSDMKEKIALSIADWEYPSKKEEAWKYSPIVKFLKNHFTHAPFPMVTPEVSGLEILPLSNINAKILEDKRAVWQYDTLFDAKHIIHMQDGFYIRVPKNTHAQLPFHMHYANLPSEHAAYVRHVIIVEEGASLDVVFDNAIMDGHFNHRLDIYLERGARCRQYHAETSSQAYILNDTRVYASENAIFEYYAVTPGAAWSRHALRIDLLGTGARADMHGIYEPSTQQHVEHIIDVRHQASKTMSTQSYRGVLSQDGCGVFQGKIHVAEGLHGIEAHQENKNILLDTQSCAYTIPQLDILSDDVLCSHGATVGHLDAEALFYMRARGLDLKSATQYLIEAFLAQFWSKIEPSYVPRLAGGRDGI